MVNYKKVALACWLFFGICIFYATVISSFVEGKQVIPEKYRGLEHKGTIKTIVSPDDVIDCVDFYKQPAFDDPQIRKDFKLKMESNVFVDESTEMTNDEFRKHQTWLKYGECPNGTIPIRRALNRETYMKKHLPNRGSSEKYIRPSHEYAIVERDNVGTYFGARAHLNVWNPDVEKKDFSLTQIWVLNHDNANLEVIEAGWIVFPEKYGDSHTRFFVFWTNNSYASGCWDLECSGFIHVNKKIKLGGIIGDVSDDSGKSYYLELGIYKEEKDGDWWLNAFGEKVGYWPNSLFRNLKIASDTMEWGGEVYNSQPSGHHSTTEMGSGRFPYESVLKASYVSNIAMQVIVDDNKLVWENVTANSDLKLYVTRPECYDATIRQPTDQLGTHFYYGGPGASESSDMCK